MNDQEIIELFFERSELAITELTVRYGAIIRGVSSSILKDRQDVEECVNDTFLEVWKSIPPQRPANLGTFCCRIARNISLNRCRFNMAQKRNGFYDAILDELSESVPAAATVETEYDAKELAASIDRFLKALDPDDRYLFMQRYWLGADIPRIAETMALSRHAVSVRLFRIRRRLQKYLVNEEVIA